MKFLVLVFYIISAFISVVLLVGVIAYGFSQNFQNAFFCLLGLLFFIPNTIICLTYEK